MEGSLFLGSQDKIHSKNREEELLQTLHSFRHQSFIYSLIIHPSTHQSFICLFIHSICLYLFLALVAKMLVLCTFDLSPVSVAAAQQRPSDVTLSVTWLRGWLCQRSLRQPKEQCRAVPCLEGSFHCRLWPSGPWVRGKGREGLLGQARIMVLDMPHSCLKTAVLGLQGSRGYRRL